MTDFHCHCLPGIDDGAESPEIAYEMLCMSAQQGVRTVVATPHFYPTEESPEEFLKRRTEAIKELKAYAHLQREKGDERDLPSLLPGAEVYFFPTLGTCEVLRKLSWGPSHYLLIEPPMAPWTERMYTEIALAQSSLGVVPVIAHADRYARLLRNSALFDELYRRGLTVQVNASFFTRRETAAFALQLLSMGRIRMLGSDAHGTDYRKPNIGEAVQVISRRGLSHCLDGLITL